MQIKNVRFIIAAITTLSAFAVYVSRVNLSIAIIAMVDDANQHATSPAPSSSNASAPTAALSIRERPPQGDQLGGGGGGPEPAPGSLTRRRMSVDARATGSNRTEREPPASAPDGQVDAPHRAPLTTIFPANRKSLLRLPLVSRDKFQWDQTAQGHILGAFFYGYVLFQIPGARMAERVGARWILMTSTAGSALISLIFPLSTQLNSIHLLMVLRFVMGLCQSAFFPAAYVFFCRWLPESERSVLLPIMFIGSNMGSISTYIMSSYLISSSLGWPSVFYVSGLICLLVTLLWALVGSNGPEDNWLITSEERAYIQAQIQAGARDDDAATAQPAAAAQLSPDVLKLNELNALDGQDAQRLLLANHKQLGHIRALHAKLNKSKSANDLIPAETAAALLEQQQLVIERAAAASTLVDMNNGRRYSVASRSGISRKGADEEACAQTPTQTTEAPARQLSWLKVFKSVPIWVLILSMYGNEWSQVVLTYELPTYLNKALRLPIEQNGVINSFFQLSYLLASPIMSSLGACLLERRLFGMRKLHVRKLFQSLATFGQMACFISVPICGPNEGLIIMFMFAAIVFKACANAGDIMVPGDLSPEFAGTIFAFANSIGNTAGVLVPFLAGIIVSDFDLRDTWTPFWLTSATIMGSSGLIFILLGQTRRQDYAQPERNNMAAPDNQAARPDGQLKAPRLSGAV